MINATNNVTQVVNANANVLFNSTNVISNACNSCRGWLNHNTGSGLFTLTKAGVYEVSFNANVSATVAGSPVILGITNAGENISGGIMQQPGTVVDDLYSVSSTVLVPVPCGSSVVITIKNNSVNPINVDNPSLTITRKCGG